MIKKLFNDTVVSAEIKCGRTLFLSGLKYANILVRYIHEPLYLEDLIMSIP